MSPIKMMSDTWFKSSKEATCSNNTHICEDFWRPAWGAWSGGKGNGANDWAIIPKTITQTSSIWAASTTKKWDFSLKNLCVYIQNCGSCVGGEHIFIKNVKKRWPENENWVRKTFNGKFDAYKKLPKTAVFRSVGENYYFLNSTRRKWPPQNYGFEATLGIETSPCTRCWQKWAFENVLPA